MNSLMFSKKEMREKLQKEKDSVNEKKKNDNFEKEFFEEQLRNLQGQIENEKKLNYILKKEHDVK